MTIYEPLLLSVSIGLVAKCNDRVTLQKIDNATGHGQNSTGQDSSDSSDSSISLDTASGSELTLGKVFLVASTNDSTASDDDGSILNTLNDGFVYNSLSPVSSIPDIDWSASKDFDGAEQEGVAVEMVYKLIEGAIRLDSHQVFVVDLYSRKDFGHLSANIDIQLLKGGKNGQLVASKTGLAIPGASPSHIRTSFINVGSFDTILVIGHDSCNGNPLTLMEVHAAVIGEGTVSVQPPVNDGNDNSTNTLENSIDI